MSAEEFDASGVRELTLRLMAAEQTLLDEFARAALPSVLRDYMHHPPQSDPEFFQKLPHVASWIYIIADHCMAERASRRSKQSDPGAAP